MYLPVDDKQLPILTILDVCKTFSATSFLAITSAKAVWDAFLKCWKTMSTGFPEYLLTDQGSIFTSADWHAAWNSARIQLRHTDPELSQFTGNWRTIPRTTSESFQEVSDASPSISAELQLALSTKAMNDYLGPKGLVPSLLVFGVMP
jgi:hypothetical protein